MPSALKGCRVPGSPLRNEVAFITAKGEMILRLTDQTYSAIRHTAETLGARWVVMIDDIYMRGVKNRNDGVWGIFDMQRVDTSLGQVIFPEPTRTFPIDAPDAAMMYAVTVLGRK